MPEGGVPRRVGVEDGVYLGSFEFNQVYRAGWYQIEKTGWWGSDLVVGRIWFYLGTGILLSSKSGNTGFFMPELLAVVAVYCDDLF